MATKQEWALYIESLKVYLRELKKWYKKLPEDDVQAEGGEGPGSNPPPPPPPPPGGGG